MPFLIQKVLEDRDPEFAQLDSLEKQKVVNKLGNQPSLLFKVLRDRDPEFKALPFDTKKKVWEKLLNDYKVKYGTEVQKSELNIAQDTKGLEDTLIDPSLAFTAGAGLAAKAEMQAGSKLLSVAGKSLLSGLTAAVGDIPVGTTSEVLLGKLDKTKLPRPIKAGLSIVIPLGLGMVSAKYFEAPLEKAITNKADRLAFTKLRSVLRKTANKAEDIAPTLENMGKVVDAELKAEDINKVISKTKELHETIDEILKSKNVSEQFKQKVLALPDYAWEFVKPEFRRDLPVPSKAMQMPEDVQGINQLAEQQFIKSSKALTLPESPITKGEPIPEGTIIPGGPVVELSKTEPVLTKEALSKQQEVPEEVRWLAEDLLHQGGADSMEEALQKVSKIYDPNDDIFTLSTKLDQLIKEKQAQTPDMAEHYNSLPEEAKTPLLERYNTIRDILYKYGINSQDLNANFGEKGLQEIRGKFGLRAVKKNGLPLDLLGQRIREEYPDLLPENFDINDVYRLLEETPSKKDIEAGKMFLYSGVNPFDAVKVADEALSKVIKTAKGKFFERFPGLKKFNVIDPLPTLSPETKEKYYDVFYGTYRPKQAQGAIKAQETSGKIKQLLKRYSKEKTQAIETIIRYLENPEFRDVARQDPRFKAITGELDKVVKIIDDGSQELLERGLLTPTQRAKWKDRYLMRLYADDKLSNLSYSNGITFDKIQKGRKIESIMDLAPKDREALGYIADPEMAVKGTIAKTWHNIATDDFYRQLIQTPEVTFPDLVVKNPFKIAKLPEFMSPKFAKDKIIPFLEELAATGKIDDGKLQEFKKLVDQKLDEVNFVKEHLPDGYLMLEGDGSKYGVLTGLPVQRDIALQAMATWKLTNEPDTFIKNMDSVASHLYSWFKIAKVPLNLRAYPRNFISNIFQFGLEGYNPIAYLNQMPRTVNEILRDGKYFKEALDMGLVGENFAQREIIDVLNKLKSKTSRQFIKKFYDLVGKVSAPYGWIDDFAKLNTYRYFRTVKGLSPLEAVKKAQEIHYDYGLVPYWVHKVRSPQFGGSGTMAKLVMSPFITFQTKSAGQLLRAIENKPATLAAYLTLGWYLKNKIEEYYRKKYGKQYEAGEKLKPDYLDNPFVVHIMTKDGKQEYWDLTQILPIGWLVKAGSESLKGEPLSGLGEVGIGQSPLNIVGEVISGKDFFTGRDLYNPLDTEADKFKKGAIHVGKKLFLPATVEQVQSGLHSQHPIALRWLTGANIYKYDTDELKIRQNYNYRVYRAEAKKEAARLKRKYLKGQISKEEYQKGMEEIKKKFLTATKSLFKIQ